MKKKEKEEKPAEAVKEKLEEKKQKETESIEDAQAIAEAP